MTLEWKSDRFGSAETLTLTKVLTLTVHQELGTRGGPTPPWRATMFGTRSDRTFATVEDAKAYVVKIAERHLSVAADRLREFTSAS